MAAKKKQLVLIRHNLSGVWVGEILGEDDRSVTLRGRRVWSWCGAADCSVLAVHGPGKGSKLTVETTVRLPHGQESERHLLTDEAWQAICLIPESR